MSTDRELLELAAKAIGVQLVWHPDEEGICAVSWDNPYAKLPHPHAGEYHWNPLISAEDALLLAVKLRLEIRFADSFAEETIRVTGDGIGAEEPFGADPYAATYRAIVRAAADIGRAMP